MLETTAPKTTQLYPRGVWSDDQFLALIREHNRGIRNDALLTAEMDAEALTDADYAAQRLAAAEQIKYEGIGDVGTSNDVDETKPFNAEIFPTRADDRMMRAFLNAFNARVAGYNLIVAKTIADIGGIGTHVFEPPMRLAKEIMGFGITVTGTSVHPTVTFPAGAQLSGSLLDALVTEHNVMTAGWYGMAEALEGTGLACPTAATADGGNAGDGTCTILKLGKAAVAEVITVVMGLPGAVSVPGEAVADVGNAGDGEVTDISGKTDAPAEDIELVFSIEATVSSPGAAVPDGGNTGDGTVGSIVGKLGAPAETITITCSAVTTIFNVVGSISGALADATVGTPYVSAVINFLITAGGVGFAQNDEFVITVEHDPTKFTVEGSVTGALAAATPGTPYDSAVIAFLVSEGETPFEEGDTFTITVGNPSAGFTVEGATSGELGEGLVGTPFRSDVVDLLVAHGAADFVEADEFTATVAAVGATAGDYIELATAKLLGERRQPRSDAAV